MAPRLLLAAAVLVATSAPIAEAASPPAPRRVAVLDFNASWAVECVAGARLSQTQREQCEILRLFADKARVGALSVLRPPTFVVMTRENTAQILKDMGGKCSEGECEVETARLLGASVVVSGEVTSMEGTWIVSLKVHDVATAALLGGADTRGKTKLEAFDNVRAETEKMLRASAVIEGGSDPAPAAVPRLVEPPKPAPPPPPPKKVDPEGLLILEVADEDAQVLLDGKELGTGPLEKELKLLEGTHQLVVMKAGYFTYQEAVKIEIGGRTRAKPKLVAVPAQAVAAPTPAVAPTPAEIPAAVAARPPPEEPDRFRKWSAEVRVGMAPIAGLETTPAMSSLPSTVGSGLRLGYRRDRTWAFEAGFTYWDVATRRTGTAAGGFEVRLAEMMGAHVGAVWSPAANPYFALAWEVGVMSASATVKLTPLGISSVDDSSASLTFAGEARFDYALGTAWFLGARAGIVYAPLGLHARVADPVDATNAASLDGSLAFVPLTLAVGYRF